MGLTFTFLKKTKKYRWKTLRTFQKILCTHPLEIFYGLISPTHTIAGRFDNLDVFLVRLTL